MNFAFIRQVLGPLFGMERRETTSRFLRAILIGGMTVNLAMIFLRVLSGATLSNSTMYVLIALFVLQGFLLFMVRRGYVNQAALTLVLLVWVLITYQAWSAGGIRDVAIYIYIVIILIAALLTNWPVSIILSILSVISIWVLAIMEVRGLRTPDIDSPLDIARDLTAIFLMLFLLIYMVINTIRHSLHAVREGEEKFRKIFHISPVAIAIVSLEEGRLLDANQAYWMLTGLAPNLAIGKTTIELGHWSSYTEREKFVNKLKERKSLHSPAHTFQTTSDEERTTLAFYELIEFEGKPAVLTMFYDITEEKKTQAALEASEQKYRNFVEQSMEGIWFLGFDHPIPTSLPAEEQVELIYKYGYVSDCNDILAQMYGYNSSAELRGVALT